MPNPSKGEATADRVGSGERVSSAVGGIGVGVAADEGCLTGVDVGATASGVSPAGRLPRQLEIAVRTLKLRSAKIHLLIKPSWKGNIRCIKNDSG
jgi:hypothetical protein